MHLTISGITVVDVIFPRVPRLPVWPRHTEFTADNLVLVPEAPVITLGGNGANAAYVAARCGTRVTLSTQLGRDAFGDLARGWLDAAGCRVVTVGRAAATAVNVTAANVRHERATLFYPGRASGLLLRPALARREALLVCGWPHPPLPALARRFREVARAGGLTALDTGPILERPWTLVEMQPLWPHLRLLLTNEYELRAVARTQNLPAALRKVRAVYAGELIVKRGADGVLRLPAGSVEPQMLPATRVKVVNTVGAGDAFNGALLAALCRGQPMGRALTIANRVAASVVASPLGVLGVKAGRMQ